jgi:ABC-type Co2+ transport system permease subunit
MIVSTIILRGYMNENKRMAVLIGATTIFMSAVVVFIGWLFFHDNGAAFRTYAIFMGLCLLYGIRQMGKLAISEWKRPPLSQVLRDMEEKRRIQVLEELRKE